MILEFFSNLKDSVISSVFKLHPWSFLSLCTSILISPLHASTRWKWLCSVVICLWKYFEEISLPFLPSLSNSEIVFALPCQSSCLLRMHLLPSVLFQRIISGGRGNDQRIGTISVWKNVQLCMKCFDLMMSNVEAGWWQSAYLWKL